jgi:type IV pilus assembly protein PilB
MPLPQKTLEKLLLESGAIEKEEVAELEEESERTGTSIDRLLISRGRLTSTFVAQAIGKFLNIEVFDFRGNGVDPEAMKLLPEAVAREHDAIVFAKDDKKHVFKVALADPTNIEAINFLSEYLKGEIQPYIATQEMLRFAFQIYTRKASEDFESDITAKVGELVQTIAGSHDVNLLESVPLTQLFDTVINYASTLGASDMYFQAEEEGLVIRFRVDGILRDIIKVDKRLVEGIVARTKILSGLRIDEHMKPQDGRFKFRSGHADIDIRTAIMPTFYGEKITLRLLSSSSQFISFDELGLDAANTARLSGEIKKPYGMILASGPTGSGKTTTIYSILNALNTPEVHITTIEDPIEYVMPRVSQTQVNMAAGITFASGLRALLRHSPDIIVVGEIRDTETAEIAVHASLTGHLLVSTIHTNDAPGAIPRLIELGVPAFFVASTLNAVVAQRLVRRICQQCIQSVELTPAMMKSLNDELERRGKKRTVSKAGYRGKGCALCSQTGYSGRIGIFEIFIVDQNVRNVINSAQITLDNLKKAADTQGMVSMFEDGLRKVEHGLTTVEEIFRAIRE